MASRRESHMGWKPQGKTGDATIVEGSLEIKKELNGREQSETVFCVKYSPNGVYAAASYANGSVRILETKGWSGVQRLRSLSHNSEGHAATSVCWRPHCPTKSSDLIVGCASGVVQQWTWEEETSADVEYVGSLVEPKNEVMCLDYSLDGNQLVSAGSDHLTRVYDTMSGKLQMELRNGLDERGYTREGHSSRIFSARFVTPHTIITAGWESPCQVWDLRTGRSEKQLLGTHVCGDALDVSQNTSTVIVSSYRHKNQIMFFDYLSGRECTPDTISKHVGSSSLYTSRLAADQTTLYCIGSKPNCILKIDIRTGELLGSITNFPHTFFSLSINPNIQNEFLVGGSHGALMVVGG